MVEILLPPPPTVLAPSHIIYKKWKSIYFCGKNDTKKCNYFLNTLAVITEK